MKITPIWMIHIVRQRTQRFLVSTIKSREVAGLYTQGGVYLDTDVQVLRSFTPLLSHRCFLGFQQVAETIDWVNSAIFGAEIGHTFLKHCLDLTQELFAKTGEFYRSPTVIMMLLRTMGLRDYRQRLQGVMIYPTEYFIHIPGLASFPQIVLPRTRTAFIIGRPPGETRGMTEFYHL